MMKYDACPHEKAIDFRHENDDRIRTTEMCHVCGFYWYRCYAKRLSTPDSFGNREAWGPVGTWSASEGHALR